MRYSMLRLFVTRAADGGAAPIVLVGGAGTRLRLISHAISKHLLPVYDKPIIYFPISTLHDLPLLEEYLGDGLDWGVNFSYAVQLRPEGFAQAFITGADFVSAQPSALILGNNRFYGPALTEVVAAATQRVEGATVYAASDPECDGVVSFDENRRTLSIDKKPARPKSHWAAAGLYLYDSSVIEIAANIKPWGRDELEDRQRQSYLLRAGPALCGMFRARPRLARHTHARKPYRSPRVVKTIEMRQRARMKCPGEVVAHCNKWTDASQFTRLGKSGYGAYLSKIVDQGA